MFEVPFTNVKFEKFFFINAFIFDGRVLKELFKGSIVDQRIKEML